MSNSNVQLINSNCIAIGGGIAGLVIATILQRQGIKVIVLDKNPEIGGRLATRRITNQPSTVGVFDYGIQYFSVTTPQFQIWVDDWLKQGVIEQWGQEFGATDKKPCYYGVNGMRGIAEYLAKDLDVRTNTEVTGFNYEKKWLIETKGQEKYQGDMLVMTAPVPQSLDLLDAALVTIPLEVRFSLEQVEYDPCITVLALLEQPSNIPAPGGISLKDDSLAWLGDNYQKGISPEGYAVTIQANPTFSDYYWDSDDAEIVYKLSTAAADYLNSPIIRYEVHRWRHSLPRAFYHEFCLGLLELPLVMAGDGFVAPTIEGAVTSAMAAAKLIKQRFGM